MFSKIQFLINACWHNLAHVISCNCINITYPVKPVIQSAVELPGRVTIHYNVHIFSNDDIIFCTHVFVGGAVALN